MKRLYIFFILCVLMPLLIAAQPSYKEINARLPQLAPHEALYILSDYQTFFPAQPHPYYHMGNINYQLISTEHPLLDYNELKLCLYNTRLYYGNCLHFAETQTIKSEYYQGVPHTGSKVTYQDIYNFLTARMDTVSQITTRCESLYERFYSLVEQYNACVALYTQFVSRYDRQKNADLLLTTDDKKLLQTLRLKADSLPLLIDNLKTALEDYPIQGYAPKVSFKPIQLYRIDGLTATDFLQNNILLWDYAGWTRQFDANQQNNITCLRSDIAQCQQNMMDDYRQLQNNASVTLQLKTPDDISVLCNRIERFDYESFLVPLFLSQQLVLQTAVATRRPCFMPDSAVNADTLGNALSALYLMQENKKRIAETDKLVWKQLTRDEQNKHADFMRQFFSDNSLATFLRQQTCFADSLVNDALSNTFANAQWLTDNQKTEPIPALPKKWRVPAKATEQYRQKNPLTSELFVAYSTPSTETGSLISIVRLSEAGSELTRLELRAEAQVKQIIQVDNQWLAFLQWQQYSSRTAADGNAVMTVLFSQDGKVERLNFYRNQQAETLVRACKLTSNLIALVSLQNSVPQLRFLSATGEEK